MYDLCLVQHEYGGQAAGRDKASFYDGKAIHTTCLRVRAGK